MAIPWRTISVLRRSPAAPQPTPPNTYPTRPIRWVVATAPGGGVDATARILAPKLSDSLGQTVVVENRPGAGGNVGVEIVARSNPDGQTLLASTSTVLTVNPSLYKMPVSIEKDLQPITVLAAAEQAVVVHPERAGEEPEGAHRAREGETRRAQLCVGGHRHRASTSAPSCSSCARAST